jgi:hypothetical protein
MELLDVRLTGLQRRNRAAFVTGSDVPGGGVLAPGEKVVLRDEAGEYFAGRVIDEHEHDGDRRYLVHVGVRLPEQYAMLRLGRVRPGSQDEAEEVEEMQAVLDMLGSARESVAGYPVPSQRLPR